MSSVPTNITVARQTIRYTRTDYTALRARLSRIPIAKIEELYYTDEALDQLECTTHIALERRLDELREHLGNRLLLSSPHLAQSLNDARKFNSWSRALVDYLVQAGEETKEGSVRLTDAVDLWLKPRFASALKGSGIPSVAKLKALMETGQGWYKPITRIGKGKAQALERWLRTQPGVGPLVIPEEERISGQVVLSPGSGLTPLANVSSIVGPLDGKEGLNRNALYCLISAKNDLEAVQAYLYKFRAQRKTFESYRKELERFLLWCVLIEKIALSNVMTEECERYKDFLTEIPADWIGRPAPQTSVRWRPFNGQLSPKSQKYAVIAIRAFFEWLVRVRYLGGNPWATVALPSVELDITPLAIHKAIPRDVWQKLTSIDGYLDQACAMAVPLKVSIAARVGPKNLRTIEVQAAQFRLARAAILLLGTGGLRRSEACSALRTKLTPLNKGALWELQVLGKGKKWRSVFIPQRAVAAIEAHWQDRGHNFAQGGSLHLLSVVSPSRIEATAKKHLADPTNPDSALTGAALTATTLYRVIVKALQRLSKILSLPPEETQLFKRVSPHALRHTFATHAVGQEAPMPLDVLQKLMGHESINTTSIYVQAEKARMIDAVEKMFKLS